MKSVRPLNNNFMKWKFFCALVPVLAIVRVVSAVDAFDPADPNAVYNYTVPGSNPALPNYSCTNFLINNSFTVNYASYSVNSQFYEPWNTINYTNNGVMMTDSGFKFDTYNTANSQHAMAGTFYNAGTVSASSIDDLSGLSVYGLFYGAGYGQIVISATNVYNPGVLDVGVDGIIKMTGQNIDLTSSTLTIESLIATNFNSFTISTPAVSSTGVVGLDTNQDWNPSSELTATTAQSAIIPIAPYLLTLTNSTSYFDVATPGPSNIVYRAVFIQHSGQNVAYQVYFDALNSISSSEFGAGAVHIEWAGSYLDPSSGNYDTNYLYLSNDYALGASTNVAVYGGVPNNFTFITASSDLLAGSVPTASGFENIFPNAIFTNRYAFMNAQLVPGTEGTNASATNPSGALTNLIGRIQISASNTLNMAGANISGPNYMSLVCSNEFIGSAGATIAAPYSDVTLGVTNGFLTITNLLMATIPQWTGTVQGWSTRWVYVDANGVTNDYRVLLVSDQLQPTTPPWIRNLNFYATNSLVIGDILNIYNAFYANAQNVTLATNFIGVGATSPDGELNWSGTTGLGSTQLPNLLWLTNNGAIRSLNNINFTNGYNNFTYYATNYTTNYSISGTSNIVAKAVTNTIPRNWLAVFINNSLITNQAMSVSSVIFTNNGGINSGSGSFILQSSTAGLMNGYTVANADITLNATNLLLYGEYLAAGRSINLDAVGQLTDGETNLVVNGLTNGNVFVLGTAGIGGADSGFNALVNPFNGDLLGTTVTNIAPGGKNIINTWAGADRGATAAGFANNLAVGHLLLDSLTGGSANAGIFTFNGTSTNGMTNAMYVDRLDLLDAATNLYANSFNPKNIVFSTNFVIYYAQAFMDGISVAFKLNHQGLDSKGNGNHFRWVPSYAGYFSYTNLVYPNGTTNTVNAALAQDGNISSGDSGLNSANPTQIFVPSEIGLNITITNHNARQLTWTVPVTATNYSVQYLTNLLSSNWLILTNYNISAAQIPSTATNQVYLDTNTVPARYYRVVVQPWLTYPY